jgi:hypothetical protein
MANLEPIHVPDAPQIHYGMKILKNLGNFENITFEASVTDVKHVDESPSEAFKRIAGFVERELDRQVENALRKLSG